MKKLLSLSLVLLIIASCALLPSCKKKTPYELVSEAIANTTTYSSYDAEMVMDMEIEMMGMKVDSKVVQKMVGSAIDTDSPVFRTSMSTTAMGNTETVDVYLKDKTYYVSADGVSFKLAADKVADSLYSDIIIDESSRNLNDVVVTLPETLFKEETVIVENSDGTQSVELSLTAEEFKEVYSTFLKGVAEAEDISDVKASAAKVKVTVDKDKVCAVALKVDLEMTIEGLSAKIAVDANFKNINKEVTPEAINGYESFQDYSDDIFDIG